MATKKVDRAITFEHNAETGIIKFTSGNGDSFSLDMHNLSDEARASAMAFGVARKCTNATALEAGSTVAEKWAELVAVAERLNSGGGWNGAAREGGGIGADSLVVLALMRVYGDTREKAEATIERTMSKKGLDRKAALKLWAGTDKVAAEIATIKAEKAAKQAESAKVSADDLIGEMGE